MLSLGSSLLVRRSFERVSCVHLVYSGCLKNLQCFNLRLRQKKWNSIDLISSLTDFVNFAKFELNFD